jgi:hypothetical protein
LFVERGGVSRNQHMSLSKENNSCEGVSFRNDRT